MPKKGTRLAALLGVIAFAAAGAAEPRLEIALTFDDLPINGALQPGKSQSQLARDTIAVLDPDEEVPDACCTRRR